MKKYNKSRFKTARKWMIFWTLFIGTGAVAGAVGMFADPTGKAMGMDAMLPEAAVCGCAVFRPFVFGLCPPYN